MILYYRTYVLQAENEKDMQAWIDCLQKAVGRALNAEHSVSFRLCSDVDSYQIELNVLIIFYCRAPMK